MKRIPDVEAARRVLLLCLAAAQLVLLADAAATAAPQPRFVAILADDMGYSGIGSYDLEEDRTELRNLAPEQPERVRELVGLYEEWAENAVVGPWPWVIRPLRRGVAALGLGGLAAAALGLGGLAAAALLLAWLRRRRFAQ